MSKLELKKKQQQNEIKNKQRQKEMFKEKILMNIKFMEEERERNWINKQMME
jgi:hypothetical protein